MYIFEINPLSVASFAVIFSQSEGCLFTLLIVSFAVQKLLSFIRISTYDCFGRQDRESIAQPNLKAGKGATFLVVHG